jgi:SAM-dependent methyltransferase
MQWVSPNVYDQVPYSNHPYPQTHPERLATVAVLHGLEPPDPLRARVLELGCGAGGNLLAMVAGSPGIRAVGVDLAREPIEAGRATAAAVGLHVDLQQADVRALTDGRLGEFDYVIAHGVYTWVPPDARDAVLATIAASLAPNGIGYVSYNANPGGYFRRMLRDVGLWFAHDAGPGAADVAGRAQALYKFLSEQRASSADTYGALLERVLPPLADGPIYRLVHDDLSEFWDPVWFWQFAGHAAAHGLEFVGEADLSGLRSESLPEGVDAEAWALAGGARVAFETLSDLLTARPFRQSVLCRAGAGVNAEPAPERAARLHWAARPNAEPLEVGLVADAFAVLDRERPHVVGFADLQRELGADPDALAAALLDGFRRERLIPHAGPLPAAREPGERPVASPLARWQAAQDLVELTSLAYTAVRMEEPAARALIALLDGTRDRVQIIAALRERTGLELTLEDLDTNLRELARLFLLAS